MSISHQIASSRFSRSCRTRRQRAYTLVEMIVVLVIMGVLTSMALPRFSRSLESARANIAGANLRAIWTAERIYWLDHRTYTSDLDALVGTNTNPPGPKLLDPSILTDRFYSYQVDPSTFTVTAQRVGSSWSGSFWMSLDSDTISGELDCPPQPPIYVNLPPSGGAS